jgi:hypothetical protein
MSETVTYPSADDAGYSDKVIEWMKMKDKRRGYAKFVTQLFIRELVDESLVAESMNHVSTDLSAMAQAAKE